MTQGAVIFAYDTDIHYTAIAQEAGRRIQQYLDIPVTLITDSSSDATGSWDHVIRCERASGSDRYWADRMLTIPWHNGGRSQAWHLSPYDRTLLIDADFWLGSDRLAEIMQGPQSLACHRSSINLPQPGTVEIKTLGRKAMDQWWATVVIFDRSDFSRDVFDCWSMIEQHYGHYADMFGFSPAQFRNDYALSLALLMCSGHVISRSLEIPWPLLNVEPKAVVEHQDGKWSVSWRALSKDRPAGRIMIQDQDVHFMGKHYLEQFVEKSCPIS